MGARVVVALAMLLLGVRVASAQPVLEPFDCTRAGFPTSTPGSTCGWITLPEDANNPESGQNVKLAVAVAHAPESTSSDEAIVFLQGGSGAAAVEDTALLAQ